MVIVYNPYNIDLHKCDCLIRKFDVDQSDKEFANDIKMTIGAEDAILGLKEEMVIAFKLGHMGDDFVHNKITGFLYHMPKESLVNL